VQGVRTRWQADTLRRLSQHTGVCKGEWPWAQLCSIDKQIVALNDEKSKVGEGKERQKQIKDLQRSLKLQKEALLSIDPTAENAFWRSYESCDKVVRAQCMLRARACACMRACVAANVCARGCAFVSGALDHRGSGAL
jgi:hypothetical protein